MSPVFRGWKGVLSRKVRQKSYNSHKRIPSISTCLKQDIYKHYFFLLGPTYTDHLMYISSDWFQTPVHCGLDLRDSGCVHNTSSLHGKHFCHFFFRFHHVYRTYWTGFKIVTLTLTSGPHTLFLPLEHIIGLVCDTSTPKEEHISIFSK